MIDTLLSPWIDNPEKVVSTFDQWKWVKTLKRDNEGNIKTHQDNGEQVNSQYEFAYHVETGETYYKDAAATVAMKSFLILFGNPVHAAVRAALNIVRIPYDILSILFKANEEFFKKLQDHSFAEAFYEAYQNKFTEITDVIGEDLKQGFLSIWYGIGIELAAFFGWMNDPFKGRCVISQIEKKWNGGASYGTDCRLRNVEHLCGAKADESEDGVTSFFLAMCFQRRGNIQDQVNGQPKYEIQEEFDTFKDLDGLGNDCEACLPGYPMIPPYCGVKC